MKMPSDLFSNDTPLDESHEGMTVGEIDGSPIVDRVASDDSPEPKPPLDSVRPGDSLEIRGVGTEARRVGSRSNFGKRGVFRIGLPVEFVGTVSTLYVDRGPYLFDILNGPVYAVDPSEVVYCE